MRSTAQREAAAFPLFFVGLWAVGLFLLWACFLCGFYATASLGLFPCPSRLAGARRRPCEFAMVVASLMGGLVAFVGLCDGVSGSFASPHKTCRGAPAPLAVRNGRCVANGRACCLCGFYATPSLGLFPCPSRLAGARRRPSQFAMVVALLMGGLVAFVGFMRRRPWACSLALVDLQGRAGAPALPARGGCPWYPAKKTALILSPAFCSLSSDPSRPS